MSSYAEVVVLVEGPTEQRFVKHLLAPYLADRSVYLTPIILDKPGERGGDVKFARAKNDIGRHLKQRRDTWITLLVDYYGIRGDWPGYAESKRQIDHTQKAAIMNQATAEQVHSFSRSKISQVGSYPMCLCMRLKHYISAIPHASPKS
jgi:hypothetical protein